MARTEATPISFTLYVGLTVTATGGPLALAALFEVNALGDAYRSAGLVGLLGPALFVPALVVWLRYSAEITQAGGLYSFVQAAAGRRIARVQAGLWILSYGLYLVYTVAYLAYDLLPAIFPSLLRFRPALQLLIPVLVAAVVLLPVRRSLTIIGAAALGQLGLVCVLVVISIRYLGTPASSLVGHGQPLVVGIAGANAALLFICASLPLFLAGEVRGGSLAVRRGLMTGWLIVAAITAAAMFPFASAAPGILNAAVPGVAVVHAAGMPVSAAVIGIGVCVSVAGVIAAEFLALTRLLHQVLRQPIPKVSRVLAGVLVAGSAASLADPLRVYADLLKPSLIALWLAQLMVFAVYPRFVARRRRLRVLDVGLAAGACALMLFGLYSTSVNQLGT
jgi:amino acid transporter